MSYFHRSVTYKLPITNYLSWRLLIYENMTLYISTVNSHPIIKYQDVSISWKLLSIKREVCGQDNTGWSNLNIQVTRELSLNWQASTRPKCLDLLFGALFLEGSFTQFLLTCLSFGFSYIYKLLVHLF